MTWKILLLSLLLISTVQCISLLSQLQNNSNVIERNISQVFDCGTTVLTNDEHFQNKTQIIFFKSCSPIAMLTLPNFLLTINNLKYLSIVSFESNLRAKNFSTSEITKIDEILSKKLKRPLLISIYSSSTDNEFLYEIVEGQLREATTVNEFLSTFSNETMRSQATSDAIKKNCAICLRIASMLDKNYFKNLKLLGTDGKCDIDCIRAICELPLDDKLEEISQKVFRIFHLYYALKLKALASKMRNETENFVAKNNIAMNLNDLATMAWKNKEFRIFEFLIRADFPFPQNFLDDREKVSTQNKFYKKLEKYIEDVQKFHEDIKEGNVDAVREFLSSHKLLKFARNPENKSAVQTAFEAQQLEILAILKGNGMSVGDVKELVSQKINTNSYKDEKKTKIRQFNHDQVVNTEEDYISKLLHKTSIYFDSKVFTKEKLFAKILDAYKEVNESFPEILEVVSKSKGLEIIFNFESAAVGDYDPSSCPTVLGVTNSDPIYVIIGALNLLSINVDSKNDVLGTIAHELMHYAMFLTYNNYACPYAEDDIESTEWFVNVTEKSKEKKEEEDSIKSAFGYEDEVGDGEIYHGELIARVPGMVMSYKHNSTHLKECKRIFNELFHYYEEKVLKDMIEMIPEIEVMEAVKTFNQWFNVDQVWSVKFCGIKKIIDSNQTSTEKALKTMNLDPNHDLHAILTNSHTFSVIKIHQIAKLYNAPTIFTKISLANYENFKQIIYEIDNLKTELILVVLCDDFDYYEKFTSMIEASSIEHVIYVGNESSSFGLNDISEIKISIEDFCGDSQLIIKNFNLSFQGTEVSFETFEDGLNGNILNIFDVKKLLNETPDVGVKLDGNEEYFIKHKLIDDEGYSEYLEDFVKNLVNREELADFLKTESSDENFINFTKIEIKNSSAVINQKLIYGSELNFNNRRNMIVKKDVKSMSKHLKIKQPMLEKITRTKRNSNSTFEVKRNEMPVILTAETNSTSMPTDDIINSSPVTSPTIENMTTTLAATSSTSPTLISSSTSINSLKPQENSSSNQITSDIPQLNRNESSSTDFNQEMEKLSEFYILSSQPGSGKTVAMKEIALRLKKSSKAKWIIFIDLESIEILKLDSEDEIIEILIQNEDENGQKFLRKFLENPQKVVIMFDNFDKSKNLQNAVNFIDRCQKYSSQLWIATRPHHEGFLAKKFKNSNVLRIFPLNHKNRETFLEYFSHLDEEQEAKLIEFVEENEIEDVQLMHEIVENWSENSYEMFSKILRKRYEDVKTLDFNNFDKILDFKLRLHREHQKLAINSLNLLQTSSLTVLKQNFTIPSEEIFKFGIVQKQNNQKTFIEVFRQFYIAQFLVECQENLENIEEIKNEILLRKDQEKFRMIARFLDDFKKSE